MKNFFLSCAEKICASDVARMENKNSNAKTSEVVGTRRNDQREMTILSVQTPDWSRRVPQHVVNTKHPLANYSEGKKSIT